MRQLYPEFRELNYGIKADERELSVIVKRVVHGRIAGLNAIR